MRGRKPDGWKKGLASTNSRGRKMPRKDHERLVEQLRKETVERARRVSRLMRAIYGLDPDEETTDDEEESSSDLG